MKATQLLNISPQIGSMNGGKVELTSATITDSCTLVLKIPGLHFILTFLDHSVGVPTQLVKRNGFSQSLEKKISLGNLAFDVDSIEESKKSTLNKIVMIQDEGEIIFVPSGWYHQVCNLEDTISINHNWFNGCNIETVYHNLILELRKVENEISDCKEENNVLDWNKLCQDVLRNSYGMNLVDLMNLLNYILKKRVQMLNCEEGEIKNSVIFDGYLLGRNHAQFDVIKVKEITLYLRSDFEKLIMLEESNICQNMIEQCDMFEFVEQKFLKITNQESKDSDSQAHMCQAEPGQLWSVPGVQCVQHGQS